MSGAIRSRANVSFFQSIDLADNQALDVFVRLRVELQYFCSLPEARLRRDYHAQVMRALEDWFSLDRPERHKLISAHLANRSRIAGKEVGGGPKGNWKESLLDHLEQASWAKVRDFLAEPDLESIELLKFAYRKAAKQCHPDLGGSEDAMVSLNSVYAILLEALMRGTHFPEKSWANDADLEQGLAGQGTWQPVHVQFSTAFGSPDPFGPQALRQAKEFDDPTIRDELVAKLYLEVLIDEWNLDGAIAVLSSQDGVPTLLAGQGPPLNLHPQSLLDLVGLLIDRCYAIRRPELCDVVTPLLRVALLHARRDNEYERAHLNRIESRLRETIALDRRPLILKHPRQRENVARLTNGTLGIKREDKAAKPETKTAGSRNRLVRDARQLAVTSSMPAARALTAFIHLPYDPQDAPPPADRSRIPFVRVSGPPADVYSPAQSWEYHEAFFRAFDVHLQEKHRWARLSSTLHSLVLADMEPKIVVAQLALIASLTPKEMGAHQDAANFLLGLEPAALSERLRLARKLHNLAGLPVPSGGFGLNYDEAGHRLTVDIGVGYLHTITAEIEGLTRAADTGSFLTPDEARTRAEKEGEKIQFWRTVSEPIHFQVHDAAKKREDDTVIRLCEDLIAKCLALGPEGLEYGFWSPPNGYEELTVSLVRLRRWEDARLRLEELFAIPGTWIDGCSQSRIQALRQRLSRCQAMCAKL
jgi:hypothetical protein